MQLIYIITDYEDGQPIIAASTEEKATQQLFDYMGYNPEKLQDDLIYKGFAKYVYSEHEDNYVGMYTFDSLYDWETERNLDRFKLFCKALDSPQK